MPVSDFECQIARGQIGRYLDGGALSSQAMTGLEEHLADCPGCKAVVAERRAALFGSLGGQAPERAVVSMPVENPLIAALRAKSEATLEKPKAEAPKAKAAPRYAAEGTKKPFGKPLALAALLAVVLLGMSRVSQFVGAPTARASASFAADSMPEPTETAKPSEEPPAPEVKAPKAATPAESKPVVDDTMPKAEEPDFRETPIARHPVVKQPAVKKPAAPAVTKPKPVVEKKPVTVIAMPKPIVRRLLGRRAAVRRASKLARKSGSKLPHSQKKSRSTVRVYGLDGRPLKP